MSEFDPKDTAVPRDARAPEVAPGATGIFGALPSEPGVGLPAPFPREARTPPPAPTPATPARQAAAPVVVHEVKFQAQEAEGSDAVAPLHRLMQSQSAAAIEPTPAGGGFTQLLSALQMPLREPSVWPDGGVPGLRDVPPVAPSNPLAVAPAPVLSSGLHGAGQTSFSAAHNVPEAGDEASFTRLFEALEPAAATTPGMAAPLPPAPMRPREGYPPPLPLAAQRPPQSPGSSTDLPASFTQLFAALGNEPRAAANQSTDYPPIVRETPSPRTFGVGPSRAQPPSWSAPPPAPAVPHAGKTDAPADLNSLTQLLQALEGPSTAGGRYEPVLPVAVPPRPTSGATVAFTPPESVQRMAAQPPAAASGPGDFTRVLQASALRESGLGSQAAAAARAPEPPVHSAPPAPTAGMPLPPWAAPPVPHLSPLPHLSHGGSPGVTLGPGPNLHTNMPGPFSMPHGSMPHSSMPHSSLPHGMPLHTPSVPEVRVRGGMPLLPMILMAIIVILVVVLVALLLRH